jgi:hypothetical protein
LLRKSGINYSFNGIDETPAHLHHIAFLPLNFVPQATDMPAVELQHSNAGTPVYVIKTSQIHDHQPQRAK